MIMLEQLQEQLKKIDRILLDTTAYKSKKLLEIKATLCDIIENKDNKYERNLSLLKDRLWELRQDTEFLYKRFSLFGFLTSRCEDLLNNLQNILNENSLDIHFDILEKYFEPNTIQAKQSREIQALLADYNFKDASTKFAELKKSCGQLLRSPLKNAVSQIENLITYKHYQQIELPPNSKVFITAKKTLESDKDLMLLNDVKMLLISQDDITKKFYFTIDEKQNVFFSLKPIMAFQTVLGAGEIELCHSVHGIHIKTINNKNSLFNTDSASLAQVCQWLKIHGINTTTTKNKYGPRTI